MTQFLDFATDVSAFAKNAGPQALRIDFLSPEGRRSVYTPDFLVRESDRHYLLAETKGRVDRDVPSKARAAIEWCKAASTKKTKWRYVYVPQEVFEQVRGNSVEELARACTPALAQIIKEAASPQLTLTFAPAEELRAADQLKAFIDPRRLEALPSRYRRALEHAVALFQFHEKKSAVSFAPVFQPLLGPIDDAAQAVLITRLSPDVPPEATPQKDFFEPDVSTAKKSSVDFLKERARSLKRLLVHRSPLMPTGLLLDCLKYASKDTEPLPGVFTSVRSRLAGLAKTDLTELLDTFYLFRNTYVARAKEELTDVETTRRGLKTWVATLLALHDAAG